MPAPHPSLDRQPNQLMCVGFWTCIWAMELNNSSVPFYFARCDNRSFVLNSAMEQWDRCRCWLTPHPRADLSYASSQCSGRSLPECRTHVFQLNSSYPAGEMCFSELWPYAMYPTSTYRIMFHWHRIWHCIKQSALSLNAYASSHNTKPSHWNGCKSKCHWAPGGSCATGRRDQNQEGVQGKAHSYWPQGDPTWLHPEFSLLRRPTPH